MIINDYYLYWIHLKSHTCIGSQGYVGISSNPTKRINAHKRNAAEFKKDFPVYRAMRKYGDDICISVIACGSRGTILELERMLRPSVVIGWNLNCGGGNTTLGRTLSDEHKAKIVKANTGRVYSQEVRDRMSAGMRGIPKSEEQKKRLRTLQLGRKASDETREKQSKAMRGRTPVNLAYCQEKRRELRPWQQSRVKSGNLFLWSIADEIYNCHSATGKKAQAISNLLYVKPHMLSSIIEHILDGWIPQNDPTWLSFKENYCQQRLRAA